MKVRITAFLIGKAVVSVNRCCDCLSLALNIHAWNSTD